MHRLYAAGEKWQLFHGDLLEVANEYLKPDNIDIVLTDPPYSWRDYKDEYYKLSVVCSEYLKDGGLVLLFMGSHSLDKKMSVMSAVGLEYLWCFKCSWKPLQATPKVFQPVPVFVASRLLVAYGKGDLNLVRARWNRKKATLDFIELEKIESEYGWAINDVVIGEAPMDKKGHMWQQNLNLFVRIAEMFVCPNDVVLDPFNGTGTTGVAVLCEGGYYIGIDVDETVLRFSAERLERVETILAQKKDKLFIYTERSLFE
jgi:DNA modification methylase